MQREEIDQELTLIYRTKTEDRNSRSEAAFRHAVKKKLEENKELTNYSKRKTTIFYKIGLHVTIYRIKLCNFQAPKSRQLFAWGLKKFVSVF